MASAAAITTARALDRPRLTALAFGHLSVDMCQGAVPAMLPFLAAQRGYSYGALGALVLAATIGSSIIQPLFGLLSDRSARPWLMPAGVLLAGAGVAVVGLMPSYAATVAAISLSGLGVAAFHPEAARFAGVASGNRRGRGMSMFSLGGNSGFAVGPILSTPLILAFGLPGTLGLLVPPLVMSIVLATEVPRLRSMADARPPTAIEGDEGVDAWGPFARLGTIVALRSCVYFGLQAFIPAWFVTRLDLSEAAGNAALSVMLVAGAFGTLAGGELVDRLGARNVVVGSLVGLLPALVLFPLAGHGFAIVVLGAIGFLVISSFSVTVVLGQQYLPTRLGLASGVTLGLAIGVGGLFAAAMGAVADAYGVEAVIWTIAAVPIPALLLSFTLPGRSTGGAT